MSSKISVRCRNALTSSVAALPALLGLTLWIAGLPQMPDIVTGGAGLFLLISMVAFALGACLSSSRLGWSLLVGTLSGLAGGAAIVLYAMAEI